MPSANTLLLTASLLSALVAAVPFHPQHLHHQHVRDPEADADVTWVTVTDDVIVTAYETVAVWVEISGTSTWSVTSTDGVATPSPTTATTSVEESSISAAAVATPSSSSVYVAPTTSSSVAPPPAPTTTSSVYTPPAPATSSSSIYTPPAPPTTSSTPVAPPPTSTYVPPPPTTPAAPASTPSPSLDTSTSDAAVTDYAASGTSYLGELSYFLQTGLGACGQLHTDSDPIVAVSYIIWDAYMGALTNPNDNPLCGRTVSITGAGGTVYTATVVDKCMGCGVTQLDLAGPEFFNTVTDNANGMDYNVSWKFN